MWISKSPVSFQRFSNVGYGDIENTYSQIRGLPGLVIPKVIYPHRSDWKICTMMVLQNLAEPSWIQVDCTEKILPNVMCVKENNTNDYSNKSRSMEIEKRTLCQNYGYRLYQNCFHFLWVNRSKSSFTDFTHQCRQINGRSVVLTDKQVKDLSPVLYATGSDFPPILSSTNSTLKTYITQRVLSIYRYKTYLVSPHNAQGFHLCKGKEQEVSKFHKGDTVILCKNGSIYFSVIYV